MNTDPIVIVAAKRTPLANMLGALSSLSAPILGAAANKAVIEQAGIDPSDISEVISGCVLAAGLGQAPARQAAILAEIPDSIGAVTVNKMCGSGMKATMLAHDSIIAGSNNIVLAGGMESMSNAPYLLKKARQGYRLGHGELIDHMYLDGLEDAYDKGRLMGYFADMTAKEFNFSRDQQDEFAITSLERSLDAIKKGYFAKEIIPVKVSTKTGEDIIEQDEGPDPAKLAKIKRLKPAFALDGTVTAANSSSISDGAASLILMRLSEANKRNIQPLAKIISHASYSSKPAAFTTAPISAIQKILTINSWTVKDIDLFEINEAFAVVTMAAMEALKIPHEKVNVNGGACALGHPIGASGARIIVTLLYALLQHSLKRGIAALCIGGGEATAIGIELL